MRYCLPPTTLVITSDSVTPDMQCPAIAWNGRRFQIMIMANGYSTSTLSPHSLSYLRPEGVEDQTRSFRALVECIPAERDLDQQIRARYGQDRWTIDAIPPCIVHLKTRAKELGLFNLFIAQTQTMLATRLSRLVLMVRGPEGLASAVEFYHKAVGLPVLRVTDDWAELSAGHQITLTLQAVQYQEAHLSTAYSPWITFQIDSMEERIAACVQAGAHLDGPIQYPAHGSVAVLRTPDHHMIGLYEPTTMGSTTTTSSSTSTSGGATR